MKHTPNPWTVEDKTEIVAKVPSPSGKGFDTLTIARCQDVEIYADQRAGLTSANVALLAAAPDLLAACQMIVDLDDCNNRREAMEAFDSKYGLIPGQGRYSLIFDRMRDVVAKALES